MTEARKISLWRFALGAISLLNLALWLLSRGAAGDAFGRRQWILAGVFTAVCAFRSVLPRIDLERFVLIDHPLSSVFIGRSLATVAEVAFAAQVSLALREISAQTGIAGIGTYALCVVPLLAAAQLFCWYSVATLNHGGHAIEESLWTVVHAGSGFCMALAYPAAPSALKPFVALGTVWRRLRRVHGRRRHADVSAPLEGGRANGTVYLRWARASRCGRAASPLNGGRTGRKKSRGSRCTSAARCGSALR